MVTGAVFVATVDDAVMRRTIGALLMLLVVLTLVQRRLKRTTFAVSRRPATLLFGLLAGFTTMVANAGGLVMSLYLLAAGAQHVELPRHRRLVLLRGQPVQAAVQRIGLGLIDLGSLALD